MYAAVLLLGVAVVVNRRGERRMAAVRRDIENDEWALRDLDRRLSERRRRAAAVDQDLRDAEARLSEAERAVEAAERRLADARRRPVERCFVFDRQEPRPGRIWAVRIAQAARAPAGREDRRRIPWAGVRVWLVVADSRKEAIDRAGLRFPRSGGYEIEDAGVSPLFPGGEEAVARPAAAPRAPATVGRRERAAERVSPPGG